MLSVKTSPWWFKFEEFIDLLDLGLADLDQVAQLYEILVDIDSEDNYHKVGIFSRLQPLSSVILFFSCSCTQGSAKIDIREYFVYSCLLNHNIRVDKLIPVIFLVISLLNNRRSSRTL